VAYFVASDLFNVSVSGVYPSEIIFSLKNQYVNENRLRGPGIYFLYFKEELVYIGFYSGSKKINNVASERFVKELETISMRGIHVSFNKTSLQTLNSCSLLSSSFQNPRHGDNGCLTSKKRIIFAEKNWIELSQNPQNWLSDFAFHWHQKSSVNKTKIEIDLLTKYLKQFYKPTSNG